MRPSILSVLSALSVVCLLSTPNADSELVSLTSSSSSSRSLSFAQEQLPLLQRFSPLAAAHASLRLVQAADHYDDDDEPSAFGAPTAAAAALAATHHHSHQASVSAAAAAPAMDNEATKANAPAAAAAPAPNRRISPFSQPSTEIDQMLNEVDRQVAQAKEAKHAKARHEAEMRARESPSDRIARQLNENQALHERLAKQFTNRAHFATMMPRQQFTERQLLLQLFAKLRLQRKALIQEQERLSSHHHQQHQPQHQQEHQSHQQQQQHQEAQPTQQEQQEELQPQRTRVGSAAVHMSSGVASESSLGKCLHSGHGSKVQQRTDCYSMHQMNRRDPSQPSQRQPRNATPGSTSRRD